MSDRSTTQAAARRFLDGYERAWASNEPDDIRALFTADAQYRTEPWAEPWRGQDAIVDGWLEAKDDPGTYTFSGEVTAVDGDRAFIEGTTRYDSGRIYSNLWVVRLAEDGRAASFTEWFMKHPAAG